MRFNVLSPNELSDEYVKDFEESDFYKKLVTYSHDDVSDKILDHIVKQIRLNASKIEGMFSSYGVEMDLIFGDNGVHIQIPCEMIIRFYNGQYSKEDIKDIKTSSYSEAHSFWIYLCDSDNDSDIMSVRFIWEVFFPYINDNIFNQKIKFNRRVR